LPWQPLSGNGVHRELWVSDPIATWCCCYLPQIPPRKEIVQQALAAFRHVRR
jgi:hypothetical protein